MTYGLSILNINTIFYKHYTIPRIYIYMCVKTYVHKSRRVGDVGHEAHIYQIS
jgi:hypothetical protein